MTLPPDMDLFLFDVEGTLVTSIDAPRPLPGARELLGRIQRLGRGVALVSNIGRKSHREVWRKLRRTGFAIAPEQLMTAGRATAIYLRRTGVRRVFILSEGGAREDLCAAGLEIVNPPRGRGAGLWTEGGGRSTTRSPLPPATAVDAVVVAADRGLDYPGLNAATRLVAAGAPLVCCGASLAFRGTYRGDAGLFLGEGAIARAIAAAAGARVTTIGKPDPRIFREVLRQFRVPAGRTAMVGDSGSDMEGAARARLGLRAYVGSGDVEADLELPSIGALARRWA